MTEVKKERMDIIYKPKCIHNFGLIQVATFGQYNN